MHMFDDSLWFIARNDHCIENSTELHYDSYIKNTPMINSIKDLLMADVKAITILNIQPIQSLMIHDSLIQLQQRPELHLILVDCLIVC